MAHLSLGVLGSLQIMLADAPVTALESDKVRALLAYLAVEADRPHRRETLIGLLWPDYTEESARHNLRQVLFNLRQALSDQASAVPHLLITRDAIQFNQASDHSLDLADFNRSLAPCERHQGRCPEDCSTRAARLEQAVRLYRGEFLAQFFLPDSSEFEDWIVVQREALRQQVLDALSYLVNYYELHADYQPARRHALRQLELDPWREQAHRQLMRVLALEGNTSAALTQYETCRRVLAEELGVEPSAKTRDLYEQIRLGKLTQKAGPPPALSPAPLRSLPVQPTPFIGREQELVELGRLITDPACRCISLVGPGGMGKTRLALQAAEDHLSEFAHGAAFVPLASVGPAEAMAAAIPALASAINFSFYGPGEPKAQLLGYLRDKAMLLVLDNVEHLLGEQAREPDIVRLIIEILDQAPAVKLLVTSREELNLQREWVFEVGGLAYPEAQQAEHFDEFEAVTLFTQRARRASPGYTMSHEDQAGIAEICRLVEGMPLAIELAATWVRTLSPAEIAKEIERSLDFLSASARDRPERHRSMRAVFDHSWQMLSRQEQRALAMLSVFRGGFQRQAAEQVAGASLPILSTLVNRTLVRRSAAGRYDLHELVRQYSAARLADEPQLFAAAQRQHYAFFLALAETADRELRGAHQLEWLGRLEQDHDNLQAALEYALGNDVLAPEGGELVLRLASALRWFWRVRGHFHEGRDWLTKALRHSPQTRTAARAAGLLGLSLITNGLSELAAARSQAEASAAIYRELGDAGGLAEALDIAGLTLVWQGEAAEGCARLEEALSLWRQTGGRWGEAQTLYRLGSSLADYSGDPRGLAMLEESTAILEGLGEKYLFTSVLTALGIVEAGLGDYAGARKRFERSLAVARELMDPWGIADALTNLGVVLRIQGEYAAAQSHLEEAQRVYQEHGRSIWEIDVLCALAENNISQGDLSTARLQLAAASDRRGSTDNRWLQVLVCYFRGLLACYEGEAQEAAARLEETTALAREGRYKPDLARALVTLGRVRRVLGQISPACESVFEGLELFQKLGHKLGMTVALEEAAAMWASQGQSAQATMLLGAAASSRKEMGTPLPPVDHAAHESTIAACRAQLGKAAFAAAWAEASARPFPEVITEVLSANWPS